MSMNDQLLAEDFAVYYSMSLEDSFEHQVFPPSGDSLLDTSFMFPTDASDMLFTALALSSSLDKSEESPLAAYLLEETRSSPMVVSASTSPLTDSPGSVDSMLALHPCPTPVSAPLNSPSFAELQLLLNKPIPKIDKSKTSKNDKSFEDEPFSSQYVTLPLRDFNRALKMIPKHAINPENLARLKKARRRHLNRFYAKSAREGMAKMKQVMLDLEHQRVRVCAAQKKKATMVQWSIALHLEGARLDSLL